MPQPAQEPGDAAAISATSLDEMTRFDKETLLRTGSRNQAISALVHIPPSKEDDPGCIWFYLSRGLFGRGSSSLYRLNLSTQEEVEIEGARQDPEVSCMCYDDVNHVVWTGHRNGGVRVWSADKEKAVVDMHRAFFSPVSAITTDERGRCWAASEKGKVRCFKLDLAGSVGESQVYRVVKLGDLKVVSEGVAYFHDEDYQMVNGMWTHPQLREPAHYGHVRSIAAACGRVWTSGGSSAFACFKEWTQQGVLLGSHSMRLTGLANDILLVSKVVQVQENRLVSIEAPGTKADWFSRGLAINQAVDVDMFWQLLTVHDNGTIQVWGIVDKVLVPLVCIGNPASPALRLLVCEHLGALITMHSDGRLRLRVLAGYKETVITYKENDLVRMTDEMLPCAQLEVSRTGLEHAVIGSGQAGAIIASRDATIMLLPIAELWRQAKEARLQVPAADVDQAGPHFYRLSAAGLESFLQELELAMEEVYASQQSLESDPLLTVISTTLAARSQPSTSDSAPSAPSAGSSAVELSTEARMWEVQWPALTILRSIGRGSFGSVYLAEWGQIQVAVKILVSMDDVQRGEMKLPDKVMRELQSEAAVMARMRHPNAVQFIGLVSMPPALITEYCSRGSLYDCLKNAREQPELAAQLTWHRRLSMAVDAGAGLLYLHSRGIIHRDVKSPNFLVDENWRTKVADFNLSKIINEAQPANSQTSTAATNPTWLAPEIVSGGRATAESDVYSFGLVLYELMTWRMPWKLSDIPFFKLAAIIREGARPEVPPRDELPGPDTDWGGLDDYVSLMQDCWAQQPEDRPSFDDVVGRLKGLKDQAQC